MMCVFSEMAYDVEENKNITIISIRTRLQDIKKIVRGGKTSCVGIGSLGYSGKSK